MPIFNPTNHAERDGCEDPRLTVIGDQCIMAYTAFRNHDYPVIYQISLTSINFSDFLNRQWNWKERILPFPGVRNKDAVILPGKVDGKYVMFHRIEPSICIAYSEDLKKWHGFKSIMEPRDKMWDSAKIGAAGTPIELNEGYLFIYHGVDEESITPLAPLYWIRVILKKCFTGLRNPYLLHAKAMNALELFLM